MRDHENLKRLYHKLVCVYPHSLGRLPSPIYCPTSLCLDFSESTDSKIEAGGWPIFYTREPAFFFFFFFFFFTNNGAHHTRVFIVSSRKGISLGSFGGRFHWLSHWLSAISCWFLHSSIFPRFPAGYALETQKTIRIFPCIFNKFQRTSNAGFGSSICLVPWQRLASHYSQPFSFLKSFDIDLMPSFFFPFSYVSQFMWCIWRMFCANDFDGKRGEQNMPITQLYDRRMLRDGYQHLSLHMHSLHHNSPYVSFLFFSIILLSYYSSFRSLILFSFHSTQLQYIPKFGMPIAPSAHCRCRHETMSNLHVRRPRMLHRWCINAPLFSHFPSFSFVLFLSSFPPSSTLYHYVLFLHFYFFFLSSFLTQMLFSLFFVQAEAILSHPMH